MVTVHICIHVLSSGNCEIYIYTSIQMKKNIYIYIYIYSIYIYIHIQYIYIYIKTNVNMCVYIYISASVSKSKSFYIDIYIYTDNKRSYIHLKNNESSKLIKRVKHSFFCFWVFEVSKLGSQLSTSSQQQPSCEVCAYMEHAAKWRF